MERQNAGRRYGIRKLLRYLMNRRLMIKKLMIRRLMVRRLMINRLMMANLTIRRLMMARLMIQTPMIHWLTIRRRMIWRHDDQADDSSADGFLADTAQADHRIANGAGLTVCRRLALRRMVASLASTDMTIMQKIAVNSDAPAAPECTSRLSSPG